MDFGFYIISFFALLGWGCFLYKRHTLIKTSCRLAEAERLLKLRGTLAQEVAHEIKNPITAILCSAETLSLLASDKLSEGDRKSLSYISQYGDQLLKLVTDFLDISMAETGTLKVKPEEVQLLPVLETLVGLLQSSAQKKQIILKVVDAAPDLTVFVDPKHLKQIIFNLIHNAIKFTEPGGEIRVSARQEFPEHFVSIEIADNGSGIADDKQRKIFDPYQRIAESSHGGLGLGLAVCKSLVELASGEISVSSTEGVGSSFKVKLPFNQLLEVCNPTEEKLDGSFLSGKKILLVAPDTGTRDSVASIFRAFGATVEEALDTDATIAYLSALKFDAVIIDEAVQDGPELARLISEELHFPGKTVLLGNSSITTGGTFSLVLKPVIPNALLNALK